MSHKIKIHAVPHKNKDGTDSKVRKDYHVYDKHRGKKTLVGVASSRSAADEICNVYRGELILRHVKKHPNDNHFFSKHKIEKD